MKKIYIASVNAIKSGEKNGRKWTLYSVIDQTGAKFSTFEAKYSGMVGQEVEVDVQETTVEKNGKTYKNLTIVEPKKSESGVNTYILAELKRMNEKIDTVLLAIEGLGIEASMPDAGVGTDGELSKDEIEATLPF